MPGRSKLLWFFGGAASLIGIFVLAVFIYLKTGIDGFSALDQPGHFEAWIANVARGIAMPSGVKQRKNPVLASPEVLTEARAHWADHCATCHANNGSGDSEIGSRVYPRPPDLRKKDTQNLTDGELFYVIEKGIRLSAMPGWQGSHSDRDTWMLVDFIRHLPQISPQELDEMKKLNPESPEEFEEEQQEQQFLNGQSSGSSVPSHHHH